MSAQPKANEPSMEEILASIRKIIADDEKPAAPAEEAAPEPVALAPQPEPEPEAEPIEARLAEKPAENRAAVIMAAACRDDQATVEAQLLARLADVRERKEALGGFISFTTPVKTAPLEMKIRGVVDQVQARPAVKARLAEFGRTIPFAGTRAYWGDF